MENVSVMIEIAKHVHRHYMELALNVIKDMHFQQIILVDVKLIIAYYEMIIYAMYVKGDIFYRNLIPHVNLVMNIKMENIVMILIAIFA